MVGGAASKRPCSNSALRCERFRRRFWPRLPDAGGCSRSTDEAAPDFGPYLPFSCSGLPARPPVSRLNRLHAAHGQTLGLSPEIFVILNSWLAIRCWTVRVSWFDLLERCVELCAFQETNPSRIATPCWRRFPRVRASSTIFLLLATAPARLTACANSVANGSALRMVRLRCLALGRV